MSEMRKKGCQYCLDLLSHELIQAGVEVSPHIAVEMNPPNTGGMTRGLHPVQLGQVARHPVHHHVLQVEELTHGVAHPAQSPHGEAGDEVRLDREAVTMILRTVYCVLCTVVLTW